MGCELAGRLLAEGHEVCLMGRSLAGKTICMFQHTDVRESVVFPFKPDAVFYLAQYSDYKDFPRGAAALFDVNLAGVVRAAQAALESGCRFFFHASTGNVYTPSFNALSEKDSSTNAEPYAVSKRLAEEALTLFSPWMRVCSGRIFGVFGPGQSNRLPVLILKKLMAGESLYLAPHPLLGADGGLHISYIYNKDLCRILVYMAEKAMCGETVPEILNLAGPGDLSLQCMAMAMGRILGRQPVFEESANPRIFDLRADIGLLRRTLMPDFTPLEEALAETCA